MLASLGCTMGVFEEIGEFAEVEREPRESAT